MDFIKLLVIVSYIIIGSVLGILLIPAVMIDFNVSHPPMMENSYVTSIMGVAIMFYCLVGLSPYCVCDERFRAICVGV